MKQIIAIIPFLCVLALMSCSKDEVTLSGDIAGLVTEYANPNQPIAGVTVTLNSKGISKTTGSDGRFEFTDLEPGTYTLQAQASGYQATTKQVTVYAGQIAGCDFQLERSAQSITISPENPVVGANGEYCSFTIQNNTDNALDYSITSSQSFVEATPQVGRLAAKAQRVITVSILNRQSITTARMATLIVNIGNNSYSVNVHIEGYRSEPQNVEIVPAVLNFSATSVNETESFTIYNRNSYDHAYSITYSLQSSVCSLSLPTSGTITAQGSARINVRVLNRNLLTSNVRGTITVSVGSSTYTVDVLITPDSEEPTPGPQDVTYGLQAYYNFDSGTVEDSRNDNDGFLSGGTFITNTPNGRGKALSLAKGQYMTIGSSPLAGTRSWSVSMWVKDFGQGVFLRSTTGNYYDLSPTWNIAGDGKITYNTRDRVYGTFNVSLSSCSGQWTMLTIVSDGTKDAHTLYVNGRRAASLASDGTLASTNTSLQIGGQTWFQSGNYLGYENVLNTDAMKVDNIRLYTRALDSDEVGTIYNVEK